MTRFAAIDEKKRARKGDKAPPIAKGFFFSTISERVAASVAS